MGSMGEVVARFGADISGFSLGIRTMTGLSTVFGGSMSGIFAGISGGFSTIGNGVGNLVFGFRNIGTAGTIGLDAITQGLRGVGAGVLQAGAGLLQMGARMAMVAVQAAALAAVIGGVVAVTIGIIAVRAAGDFQQGLTRLVTGAGDVTDNMQKMGQGILGVSTATGILTSGTDGLNAAMYLVISSGQRGAQALDTLKAAAQGAQIEQARVGDVTQILTTIQTNFGVHTHTAAQYMDGLVEAVKHGKITLEALSTAMSPILPMAHELGIHFQDVASAESVMTNAGIPAEQGATALRFVMQSMILPTKGSQKAMNEWGLDTVKVAAMMKTSLPNAIQMYIDAAKKAGPEGSQPFIDALSQMMGGGQRAAKALFALSQSMGDWHTQVNQISTAMKSTSTNVAGWSTAQQNLNLWIDKGKAAIAAAGIAIGTQLLPTLTQIAGRVVPVITAFADWVTKSQIIQTSIGHLGATLNQVGGVLNQVGGAFNSVFHPIQQVTQALAPLTDTFTRASGIIKPIPFVLNPMLDSFTRATGIIKPVTAVLNPMADSFDRATAVLHRTAPAAQQTVTVFSVFHTIFQAVANVITFFVAVYQRVSAVITASIPVFHAIWAVLVQVGAFLASTFAPVWAQLISSFHQIQAALAPVMPQLTMVAQIIGAVLVGAIIVVIAVIAGLVTALAGILIGLTMVITGVIQFCSGLVQFISSAMQLVADIFTGQWGKIAGDLGGMLNGIQMMIQGVFNVIGGIIYAGWQVVVGFTNTFVSTVVGIITGLANSLVGHSIIPDMITAIIAVFATLAGRVTGPINSAVQTILGILNGAIGLAMNAGSAIVRGIANGITAGIGFVAGAISNVVGFIADHLPRSPAKIGPLSKLDEFGPALTSGFARGIVRGTPEVTRAMNLMVMPPAGNTPQRVTGRTGGASGPITIILEFDRREFARTTAPEIVNEMRLRLGGSFA